ncbi:type II toxin-antitoxin system YafQ family toxin [Oceanispirochaeta sp.]|jgi:mRNA interferase YafQ|uniref:type II toxin-antitoxin system YafQ family toxin n=1 Tax=Oceanispirochaeta sp. TaxID=2035350 RepID=UPI0026131B36|nr:type II toxin-antitoxin system YafQ family toxin [Oceanispirochaeta sp.]MDA3958006.1 type II toxin-antitoxin system YafQ family toxin [Oceanispirochaeta sp.]
MYSIEASGRFKKDMKQLQKSGNKQYDLTEVGKIAKRLAKPEILPQKNHDPSLSGNWKGFRECHVSPDLLLIYYYDEEEQILVLYRVGSHSELFRMGAVRLRNIRLSCRPPT